MFIKRMYFDEWQGTVDKGGYAEDPTIEEIAAALTALDGDCHTQVVISDETDDAFISGGGGKDGLYVVYITLDGNESFYNLLDDKSESEETITLMTAGEPHEYPRYACVDYATMLKAFETFANEGKVDENLKWEYENA